jgi:hypothetical protein
MQSFFGHFREVEFFNTFVIIHSPDAPEYTLRMPETEIRRRGSAQPLE